MTSIPEEPASRGSPYRDAAPSSPRVFVPSRSARLTLVLCGAIELVAGVAFVVLAATPADLGLRVITVCLGLFLILVAVVCFVSARRNRIVIDVETLTVLTIGFRERTVRLDDIRGRRESRPSTDSVSIELVSGVKPIVLGRIWEPQAELDAWIASLPDLDAHDRERRRAFRGRRGSTRDRRG